MRCMCQLCYMQVLPAFTEKGEMRVANVVYIYFFVLVVYIVLLQVRLCEWERVSACCVCVS